MAAPGHDGQHVPCHLQMQWHITQRCNLRCTHCYQSSYENNDLPTSDLLGILGQYKDALRNFSERAGHEVKGSITLTGGEPLVRPDLDVLLGEFAKDRRLYSFAILTNGTMIDMPTALRLRRFGPEYVQVSIEGTEETHDRIRGRGSYAKTMDALRCLSQQGIYTVVSFTAHKGNASEFPDVVAACERVGASRVWSDRLIPTGSGAEMAALQFSPLETKAFFGTMRAERDRLRAAGSGTEVALHRALQFIDGGKPYACSAGKTLVAVDANADVYPCRRMPIKVGNLLESTLLEIYSSSPVMRGLQTGKVGDCAGCPLVEKCAGGLRCLSYATTGSPYAKDPGCWVR